MSIICKLVILLTTISENNLTIGLKRSSAIFSNLNIKPIKNFLLFHHLFSYHKITVPVQYF